MNNKCIVCGVEFESPNVKKYCSNRCYHKGNYTIQEIEHVCGYCGDKFTSRQKRTKFCSVACNDKHRRREQAEVKYCRVCGKVLGKLVKNRVYCSKECLKIWEKENPRWDKTCLTCGGEFKTNDKKQKYCSHKCQVDSLRRTETFTCKNCSKEFIPKVNNRTTFCSRECTYEHRAKNRKPEEEKKLHKLICTVCGFEFEAKRKRLYCSNKCMRQRYKKPKVEHAKKCRQCGDSFITTNKRNDYCSDICNRKHKNRKDYIRRDKKLKKNGKMDHSITLDKLYKKDKGICYICGEAVDMMADYNSNWYGSIDHVNPVSKGGTHTWDNVKLAHRLCNSNKSNNDFYTTTFGQVTLSV